MTWEYKVLPRRREYENYTEEELIELGAQGWEVVACSFHDESGKVRSALLKREVRFMWGAVPVKTDVNVLAAIDREIQRAKTAKIDPRPWQTKLAKMLDTLESAESEAAVTGAMQALLDEFPDPSPEQITLSNLLELLSYAVEDRDLTKAKKLISQIRAEVVR